MQSDVGAEFEAHDDPRWTSLEGGPPPPDSVLHWYDFVCPFCYLAQPDNDALQAQGVDLVEYAFIAHPEIPEGGLPFDPSGPRFEMIARLAAERRMPLRWRDRLPFTLPALAAAEWIRLNYPAWAAPFRRAMFEANFAEGQDIGSRSIIVAQAERIGVPTGQLECSMNDGSALDAARRSTTFGSRHGVRGTPAWWYRGHLLEGLPQDGLTKRIASANSLSR